RIGKKYRNEILDHNLRARRTKQEAEMLHHSKLAGADTPEFFFADPKNFEIVMEFIPGQLLRDIQSDETAERGKIFAEVGKYAAKLHGKGIIHGDLTTKNIILSVDRMVLID